MQVRERLKRFGNEAAQVHGAKRRAGSIPNRLSLGTGKHTGGQNPPCAHSEPHHPNLKNQKQHDANLPSM